MHKAYRITALLLLLVSLLPFCIGCKKKLVEPVYGHCEGTIELPPSFSVYEAGDAYDVAYSDGTVVVGILRLSYAAMESEGVPSSMSPKAFADKYYRVVALEGITATETRELGDVIYYTYELPGELGTSYTYMPTFYFTPYAYFVITYIVPSERFEEKKGALLGYAETFKIIDYQPAAAE